MLLPESSETIQQLKSALGSASMPPREAESCARLLERLTRPVRVGVFGLSTGGNGWLLDQILGAGVLPSGDDWPTLEVVHGPRLMTHATYGDGLTSTFQGQAGDSVLAEDPVFLRIEAPLEILNRMRFLYLATDDSTAEQIAALDWAEPRTDISVWATQFFGQAEIEVWARAPDGLKNHALLVTTSARQDLAELERRAGYDFHGVYAMPRDHEEPASVAGVISRLEEDIAEARAADLDAAHVFLHRMGHLVPAASQPVAAVPTPAPAEPGFAEAPAAPIEAPEPVAAGPVEVDHVGTAQAKAEPVAAAPTPSAPQTRTLRITEPASPEMQAMLSEPILYLKRRARALLELVEWQAAEEDADEDQWAGEVLSHCCETTDALQMRAMDWPEDEACALTLRRTLDEACDVAILLQVEGGKDQAQDAAMMLLQLRGDFERELAA